MDKKNIAIIAVLVIIILFYFQIMEYLGFYTPATSEPPVQQDSTVIAQAPIQQDQPVATPSTNQPIETALGEPSDTLGMTAAVDSLVPVDTIIVRTNKYEITLSSKGGGPNSLILNEHFYRDGERIQMLPDAQAATPDMSFAGGTYSASQVNYRSDLAPGSYDATSSPTELTYTHQIANGGELVKKYTFYPDTYHYDLEFSVNGPDKFGFDRKYELIWNTPLGVTEPQASSDYESMEAVAMMADSRETLDDYEDDRLKQSLSGYTTWAGVRSKYFASVLIPRNRDGSGAVANGYKDEIETVDGTVKRRFITSGIEMEFASVASFTDTFSVFVGPLDYGVMSDYDVGLEDMLGIGTTPFVGWLIKPFAIGVIWLLPKMYDIIPNYGFVIILFAFLVKLITLPLSMKSFKSMQGMKDLQPKIEELKKKYKKNPQQMNSEMMKLYKKHGVNPMSGCLPILPQMPLFFALFSVFRQTILLRDAPWIWFIDDLSRGASSFTDPYIFLVILMVAAQFISQKMTMASTQQNKAMMYVIPVFMGWAFHSFASGLVLYWTCFSVFSLLDYVLFKRNKVKNSHVQVA
ncbi:MAG: membrane protein insertase YidC [bacterium]|nr:membrane protein insertase YidC [bacterium]